MPPVPVVQRKRSGPASVAPAAAPSVASVRRTAGAASSIRSASKLAAADQGQVEAGDMLVAADGGVVVECSFGELCGAKSNDPDPVDKKVDPSKTTFIRWGKSGKQRESSGGMTVGENNCYFCERTWKVMLSESTPTPAPPTLTFRRLRLSFSSGREPQIWSGT